MENLIIIIAIVGVAFLYWKAEKPSVIETSQDFFQYKKIHSDGMVELKDQEYRKVMQIFPIDISTESPREQAAIWENFRTMVSSLNLPISCLIQSTSVDIVDYMAKVDEQIKETDNPTIQEMGQDYLFHIRDITENRKVKAKKYYIIVKINLSKDTDMGTDEENKISEAINSIIKTANKDKKLTDEEAEILARSELDNAISVIKSYLKQTNIEAQSLDKHGVINMMYETFNRDLSTTIRTKEVNDFNSFSLFTTSITPELYNDY